MAEKPLRQACWAMAHATKVFPVPVMPVTITFWCSCTQRQVGELSDDGLVELPTGRVIDVLDARLAQAKFGLLEQAAEPLVFAGEAFGVDEKAEALVEGQLVQLGILVLLRPCGGKSIEAQGAQFVESRFGEHRVFLLQL